MAWRPTQYLFNGELDNSTPGKVTGWMCFAGLDRKMTFDLKGDFHRDIRGAKVRLRGDGCFDDPAAASYMDGIALHQTGTVGDMTAGLPPHDYSPGQPYFEWYGDENGRVVLELSPDQVEVIGKPIPFIESDPISREQQQQNMAGFLGRISVAAGVHAIAVGRNPTIMSDPAFTHWVVESERIVGEAHSVEAADEGRSCAFVRLFSMPEMAEFGNIAAKQLREKNGQAPA